MKKLILSCICLFGLLHADATEKIANHMDLTHAIIDCQDEASAAAAIPQLLQLKEECDKLVETQQSLPEPTIQDYMAVQNQMEAFNTVWNAIREHIERLESNQLLTAEMRRILHIAPAQAGKQ